MPVVHQDPEGDGDVERPLRPCEGNAHPAEGGFGEMQRLGAQAQLLGAHQHRAGRREGEGADVPAAQLEGEDPPGDVEVGQLTDLPRHDAGGAARGPFGAGVRGQGRAGGEDDAADAERLGRPEDRAHVERRAEVLEVHGDRLDPRRRSFELAVGPEQVPLRRLRAERGEQGVAQAVRRARRHPSPAGPPRPRMPPRPPPLPGPPPRQARPSSRRPSPRARAGSGGRRAARGAGFPLRPAGCGPPWPAAVAHRGVPSRRSVNTGPPSRRP